MTKTQTFTTTQGEIQHKQLSYTLGTKYSEQATIITHTHIKNYIILFYHRLLNSCCVCHKVIIYLCSNQPICIKHCGLIFLRKLLKLTNTKIVYNDLLCSCRQTQITSWRLSVDYLWLHEHSLLLHLCQLSHLSIF